MSLDVVVEAHMKKEYYIDNISMNDVVRMEEKLYKLYQDAIINFEKKFSSYNCNIRIINCWTTDNLKNATNVRPILHHKYIYWICYEVLYNGKPVIYDDENSPLTRSYSVLVILKVKKLRQCQFLVKVFNDTEDVMEELMDDLNKIKQMFSHKAKSDEITLE